MDSVRTSSRSAVLLFGLVFPLLSALPLEAQRLVGYVVDEATRNPIGAADIVIIDSEGRQQRSTVTDDDGWFQFAMAAPGSYTIRVAHIGYTPFASETIELGRGETVEIRVRLGMTVIPLEPLEVTARSATIGRLAEFHQRLETRAFGRFLAREDIEARPVPRVTDLLRTQPGVRIESARRGPFERPLIAMRGGAGSCQPNLYIDGVRVRQSVDFPIDDLIAPDMLEGVEIYTNTGTAPAQYQAASQCGVVLFWTRQGEPGRPFSWKRLALGVAAAGLVVLFFVK
jgi:hypothetical protein